MVETACENNDERVESDSETIENIVEKGMVVAVLADNLNYEYYLQKLTTGPWTIEQIISDSWGDTFDRGSKIVRGLYYDRVQSKPFFYSNWFPGKLPRVILPRSVSFVLNKKEITLLFRKSYILTFFSL